MTIRLVKINKSFDNVPVLKDVDMAFPEGSITCIMGVSGIGKTTLMNVLMGVVKPDSGDIHGMRGKKVAAVFQESRLIEHWDAVKNVLLVCGKNINAQTVEEHFEEVGLRDYDNKPVRNLSGGMKQRVAIVRAILAESNILIMDEPLQGLDEELKQQVIDYVQKHTKGKTVLIISHDKDEVGRLGAGLVILR